MTKEIIIDGVNVAECFYFIDHTPPKGQGDWCGAIHKGACKVYSKDCGYNKDCHYKQLKRLEKENDRLNKKLEKYKNYETIERFLKERIENECTIADVVKENEELKAKKAKYYQQTLDDEIQINELFQILQEIKAIAKIAFLLCDDDCGNANKFQEIIKLTKAEEE